MKIMLVSPVRLFRECIAASLAAMGPAPQLETEVCVAGLLSGSSDEPPDVAVVDVTQGVDLDEVGLLAVRWADVPLLALGLLERREDVIKHGQAGFVGYIARDASIEDLLRAVTNAAAGRLECPAEISGGLIRALFRRGDRTLPRAPASLTGREADVLHLVGQGFSNKEIARDLGLSVATVKCHVHNMLGKLGASQRTDAMRRVRAMPWLGSRG